MPRSSSGTIERAMNDPVPSFPPSPSRPKLGLRAGASDTHVHVFGPQRVFPFAENRPFTPADAPNLAAVPDDGMLVDLLAEIAPSEALRRSLLVEGPMRFCGFGT